MVVVFTTVTMINQGFARFFRYERYSDCPMDVDFLAAYQQEFMPAMRLLC